MPTVYVTEPGSQVHKDHERLVVMKDNQVVEEIPLIKIDQLVLLGRGVAVTTSALFALAEQGVDVVYLTGSGRYVSRMVAGEHKHTRLRFFQAQAVTDENLTGSMIRAVVRGKVSNQRTLVQRHAEGAAWAGPALKGMADMANRVYGAQSVDEMRGLEGQAAKYYFSIFRELLKPASGGQDWGFQRREYYPPPDPVNAMLSFGYTLLLKDMTTACQLTGLDPYLGFFHTIDYGRPSMALDLMESFRPIIVDSIVLRAVNTAQIHLDDFSNSPGDEEIDADTPKKTGVYMNKTARKKLIGLYENRVNETVLTATNGERTTFRRIFLLQAQQAARVILKEETTFVPFTTR